MTPNDTEPDDYQYDVFLSYKREELILGWTREVHNRFKFWLSEELGGREVQIFFDEKSIETGQRWPVALRSALKHSRCILCIWSPKYFQSSWCMSELHTFLEREKSEGYPKWGLIAPMKFHDGEHFPEIVRDIQWTDVSSLTSTLPTFWDTSRAVELEDLLKNLAKDVARIIRNAPRFKTDWPTVENPSPSPQPPIVLERL